MTAQPERRCVPLEVEMISLHREPRSARRPRRPRRWRAVVGASRRWLVAAYAWCARPSS